MDTPSLQQLLDAIKAQIAAGRKIEAVKLYRQATGASLAEAKEAIELIEAGRPPRDTGVPAPLAADASRRVKERIASGNLIEAIKLYRQATGVDLKQAKEAVEAMGEEMLRRGEISPAVASSRDAGMRRVRRLLVLGVAILLAVAAAIVLIAMRQ